MPVRPTSLKKRRERLSTLEKLAAEDLKTLKQASKHVPTPRGRKKPHYITLLRWADRGLRGHKLETVKIGQHRYTTLEALHRFLALTSQEVA